MLVLGIKNGLDWVPKAIDGQKGYLIEHIELINLIILEGCLGQKSILMNDELEERDYALLSIGKVDTLELTLSIFWLLHVLHV